MTKQSPRWAKVFPIAADKEEASSAHSLRRISDQPTWIARRTGEATSPTDRVCPRGKRRILVAPLCQLDIHHGSREGYSLRLCVVTKIL